MHVVLAGGGTAGHIEPALAVADALRRLDPMGAVSFLGTARGLEGRLVPARGHRLDLVTAVPLPRRPTPALLTVPGRLARAVAEARGALRSTKADVVVGFGGYVSLPAYLAARTAGVAIVVHEANARPGLANRIGARLTRHVLVGTPHVRLPHADYVGIPLRQTIAALDRAAARQRAHEHFGLRPDLVTLLVMGGSQGARRINNAAVGAAPTLAAAGIQVLHATGARHAAAVAAALPPRAGADPAYVVVPYVERMDLAYAAADLALCRAGALSCAELAAVGLPAVYVPLPIGNGEQRLNALPVVRAGGGVLVEDARLDDVWVRREVLALLKDQQRLAAMGEAAARFGRRDADEAVARVAMSAAKGAA